MIPTDCTHDPFGEDGSDFEVWPQNPDDLERYDGPDLLT